MLEELRIKLHKAVLGKPKTKAFVNPYLRPEVVYNPRGLPINGIKQVNGKAKKPLSFPFVAECVQVVKDDASILKTPAGKVGDMIREHNIKRDMREQFDTLAKKGMG